MIKDNGGSAFPDFPIYGLEYEIDEEGGVYSITHDQQSLGMSLRDYFAAKAMQAEMSKWKDGHEDGYEGIAELCYCMADAMIRARDL
jgi:hypothetical protein